MTIEVSAKPTAEKRSVYQFGKRKSTVWDAQLVVDGAKFVATGKTKSEALAAVVADADYVRTAGRLEGHGCKLYAQGAREWCFVLPSGGSMCFSAADLSSALARVKSDYADHDGCAAFFAST